MLDVGQHLHHAEVARQVDGRVPEPHAERGRAQREQRGGGDPAVQQWLADNSPGQARPQPGRLRMGQAAAEVGQLEPVRPRSEPGQQGRQEEQRAEHGDADHHDRAEGDTGEDVDPGQEQPGERHHDGEPGYQDGAPRRSRGDPDHGLIVVPVHPLLAFPAQVEQRVVDADGHPDHQDELGGARADREPSPGDAEQRDGGDHGGAGQQHGDAGRDQRAEHGQQQDQRQRDRRPFGLAEVAAEQRVGDPVGAGVTRLPHQQVRVLGLDRRTAARSLRTVVWATACGPATLKVTSATGPWLAVSPRLPRAYGRMNVGGGLRPGRQRGLDLERDLPTSAAAAVARCRSPARAWISTLSVGGVTTPRLVSTCSPRPA